MNNLLEWWMSLDDFIQILVLLGIFAPIFWGIMWGVDKFTNYDDFDQG